MKFHSPWKAYQEALLRLIYPASCSLCHVLLELTESGICESCTGHLESARYSLDQAVIPQKFDFIDEACSLFPYESPVKELIAGIKFLRKRWLIRVFEEAFVRTVSWLAAETNYDAIVPIPIDWRKRIRRQFNQAELIGSLISSQSGIPLQSGILKKRYSFADQSQLGRTERLANAAGAFQVRDSRKINKANLLLVDDIFTTGSTAEEAAKVLKQGGAARVDLLTIARTDLVSSSRVSARSLSHSS